MVRISRLETKTQEIVLLLTVVATLSILVGGLFFLLLSANQLVTVTGAWGAAALNGLFSFFGLSTFMLGLLSFALGRFVLIHTTEVEEILGLAPRLLFQVFLQAWVVAAASSYLTIIEIHFQIQAISSLRFGIGGALGGFLGGNFYHLFGLFGSLTLVSSLLIIIGIVSGQIQLVSLLLHLEEFVADSLNTVASGSISVGRQFVRHVGREWKVLSHAPTVAAHTGFSGSPQKLAAPLDTSNWPRPADLPPLPGFNSGLNPLHRLNYDYGSLEHNSELQQGSGALNQMSVPPLDPGSLQNKENNRKIAPSEGDPKAGRSVRRGRPASKVKSDHQPTTPSPPEAPDKDTQIEISPWKGRYQGPEAALLKKPVRLKVPSNEQIRAKCQELEDRLASFQIKGKVTDAHVGASLTMYEFQPDPGVKVSKITSLTDDLALMLGASTLRILAPIPGKRTLGIEVPNEESSPVSFASLLPALQKEAKELELPVALGIDVHNDALVADLVAMPHLLVAGTTGSGKSVFMNALISGLLFTRSPKDLRFIMIDPKMIELSPYNGIPHLLRPVVTDVNEAKDLLVWAEQEMDRRYQMFSDLQARNITSFNEKIGSTSQAQFERRLGKKLTWSWSEMPYIVIVIDELADLMLTQGREVEVPITRIAQKARAAGIHLVIATQRPSADIVTGLIKTNFPTRISFKVSSAIDSRTILDDSGAERLLGKGDMLFLPNGQSMQRIQGCFLAETEVKKIVQSLSS